MATDPKRVQAVFLLAVEQADRAAVLARECGSDAELRRRVEALLAAHDEPGSLPVVAPELTVDEIPANPPADSAPPDPRPADDIGTVVAGRYKLLQQIGEGGMGSVFMAEQTRPVKRMVAVKLIKAGMDSRQVLARFESERQALALMDHPNIAKVLDAGTTERGHPFFVMELVKGVPLTQFCDDRQLSVGDRLAIFLQICRAVQHAHQKGIIHRDLKPTNILVESHDGRPVPKVIDFGLAKAVNALPLTDRSLFTHFGAVLGTPLYMAPEQAEFSALDVDTRADIYALGVILYELLTGTTPLEKKRFAEAAWDEIRRVIKEEEPQTPSARLSSSEGRASIAARRHTEPNKLGKFVRGELDWIVMKALAKERDRRYDTANAFAADVERFLGDEPVLAGPPTVGYKVRKFVRRHRSQVAVAAVLVFALVAGAAVSTWQAVRATRAEGQTALERDRAIEAEREAQREEQKALKSASEARAMVDFFKELTLEARRSVTEGETKWRDRRMDESVAIIDSERVRALFAGHPLAEAEILAWIANQAWPTEGPFAFTTEGATDWSGLKGHTFTTFFQRPGGEDEGPFQMRMDAPAARRHLERALMLRTAHLGPKDVKTLATMRMLGRTLGSIDAGKGLVVLGDLIDRSNATLGPDHEDTLRYKDDIVTAYKLAGRLAEAETILRECLSIREKKQLTDWATFTTRLLLGDSLLRQKKYAEAEAFLLAGYKGMSQSEEGIRIWGNSLLIDTEKTLVKLYDAWGKRDKAEEWRKKAKAGSDKKSDPKP